MTVDQEQLAAEREFLLRSLDDLEAEHDAGNIDPDTYQLLHDDYTARAAAVIQSLDDGIERPAPEAPAARPLMKWLTIGGVVVFCALAAYGLARTSGQRPEGETITGNAFVNDGATTTPTTDPGPALAAAVKAKPDDYGTRMQYATYLASTGEVGDALQQYDEATRISPREVDPLLQSANILAQAAGSTDDEATRAQLLASAIRRIQKVHDLPNAPIEAFALEGLLEIDAGDLAAAKSSLQRFLAQAPTDHPMRPRATEVLEAVVQQSESEQP